MCFGLFCTWMDVRMTGECLFVCPPVCICVCVCARAYMFAWGRVCVHVLAVFCQTPGSDHVADEWPQLPEHHRSSGGTVSERRRSYQPAVRMWRSLARSQSRDHITISIIFGIFTHLSLFPFLVPSSLSTYLRTSSSLLSHFHSTTIVSWGSEVQIPSCDTFFFGSDICSQVWLAFQRLSYLCASLSSVGESPFLPTNQPTNQPAWLDISVTC